MKEKDLRLSRILSLIFSVGIVICSSLPWLSYEEKTYTAFSFIKGAIKAGGIVKFIPDGEYIYVGYLFLYFVPLTALLYGIYALLLILNKKTELIKTLMRWSEALYMLGLSGFQGYDIKAPIIIVGALVALEFVSSIYLPQRQEVLNTYFKSRQKEREFKAERKRRLNFPGKYSRDFYRVVFANFRRNWKNQFLFILSGALVSLFLTVILGTNKLLQKSHSKNDFFSGKGLSQVMLGAVALTFLISVFLMAYVFSYYIKTRISDYKLWVILGIRQKALTMVMIMEYLGSLLLSLIIGLVIGTGFLIGSSHFLVNKITLNKAVYLQVIISYCIIVLIAFAANYDAYEQIRASMSASQKAEHERIPRIFPFISTLIGIAIIRGSLLMYKEQGNHESSLWLIFIFVGTYLVLTRGEAFFLKISAKFEKYHYQKLIMKTPFSYRFKKSMKTIFMLMSIHLFALGFFLFRLTSILIAPHEEKLVPFDYVYLAHQEDQPVAENFSSYQILRVTSAGSNLYGGWGKFMHYMPHGQNIGMSESTYQALKEEVTKKKAPALHLKGEEIHIVYQQDGSYPANPLDVSEDLADRQKLKIGTPNGREYVVEKGYKYLEYCVKSQEFSILTGMFEKGMEENIVVFSDELFEKAYETMIADKTDSPTKLWLINVTKGKQGEVRNRLQQVSDQHPEDRKYDREVPAFYEKQEVLQDISAERYSRITIYLAVIAMLIICSFFISYIRFTFSKEEMINRYTLLANLGMKEKDIKKAISEELRPFGRTPILTGVVLSALLTGATFYVRSYSREQIQKFLQLSLPIWLGYCLLQIMFVAFLIKQATKEIVGK